MTVRLTHDEREAELGQHLRGLRLRQNIDQRQFAERADVALNAVKNLEGGLRCHGHIPRQGDAGLGPRGLARHAGTAGFDQPPANAEKQEARVATSLPSKRKTGRSLRRMT